VNTQRVSRRPRTPVLDPRMGLGGGSRRELLRLPVPEDIAARVDFGNEYPSAVSDRYWAGVRCQVENYVQDFVPNDADRIRVVFDEDAAEIVLSFQFDCEVDVQ
jgi:hypothetical protein